MTEEKLKCYFCGTEKGLKSVWLDDDEADEGIRYDSCCLDCYNDPDNAMDGSPIGSSEWYSTDYHWQDRSFNETEVATNG